MDAKDLKYLFQGLTATLSEYYSEVYDSLIVKGKKKLGRGEEETPAISELIRKVKEEQSISEMLSKGEKGQAEFTQAIAAEVRRILSRTGVITRSDLARVEKRLDEIEKYLERKG